MFSVIILFILVGVSFSEEVEIIKKEVIKEKEVEPRKKAEVIALMVGETTVRGCGKDTWLVSVGNPEIADVDLKKAGERKYVFIEARARGVTNVVVCKKDETEVFEVLVTEPGWVIEAIKGSSKEETKREIKEVPCK